jgi:hypothetical protein
LTNDLRARGRRKSNQRRESQRGYDKTIHSSGLLRSTGNWVTETRERCVIS